MSSAPIAADAVVAPRHSPWRLALLRLRARGRLELGRSVRVGPGVRVHVAPGARLELGDEVVLGPGARIEAEAGIVRLGRRARLGERAVLTALSGIDVGADAVIGDWAVVADAEPTFADVERPVRLQPLRRAPVRIGERVRVGAHAAVMPGVTVGPGAVVASYAVVRRSVRRGRDAASSA